jgi:hypothetical protein
MVATLLRTAAAFGFLAIAGAASAATLLTSDAGYTGPDLYIGSVGQPNFLFTGSPTALPGGVTFSSTTSNSVIGLGGYGLGGNGFTNVPIIGLNSASATMTLTFDTAVASFGLGMNYAPVFFGAPVIAAYDGGGALIASYNLAALAPISTPAGLNAFAFRGIDGGGVAIKSFTMSGAYIIASASTGSPPPAVGGVPEPSTWAMLIVGFGFVGSTMRNRRTARHTA